MSRDFLYEKTGTEYIKPFAKELFGVKRVTHYAYPKEALIDDSIFPYLVFDGGASQFALDRFGTINGDDLLKLTLSGELFKEFTHKGQFNWESSFSYTGGTDFTPKYEWQIWPQRLYMTIPVAHAFLKTGEKKYADAWIKIVKGWDEAHPYQPFDPNVHYLKTDMTWRDMQVAWRTMSLLHGLFMLQDAPFTKEEWKYLYDFTELHVKHLYVEALDRLAKNHAQNHVLQIGVVLIMAGVMFPEFENAEEIIKIGKDTVEMNLRRAIFADGGSDEDSPSYSHFIVRLYLEALLLLQRNGIASIDGLEESIVKQYEWLYQMSTPKGGTLRISDSYAMDSMADIARAERLIKLDFPREKKSVHFKQSGTAVMRKGDITLYVDAMEYHPRGHQHTGRPQIVLYYKDEPVIIDAGCCSYDRWELYWVLRSMKMHNTVFCPDIKDLDYLIDCRIKDFDSEAGIVKLESKVRANDISYIWERTLTVGAMDVTIEDFSEASQDINWESRLFLKRNDTHTENLNTVYQLTKNHLVKLSSDRAFNTELLPVMSDENKIDYSVVLNSSSHGSIYTQKINIEFTDR